MLTSVGAGFSMMFTLIGLSDYSRAFDEGNVQGGSFHRRAQKLLQL
jgi:hypothetical protein